MQLRGNQPGSVPTLLLGRQDLCAALLEDLEPGVLEGPELGLRGTAKWREVDQTGPKEIQSGFDLLVWIAMV